MFPAGYAYAGARRLAAAVVVLLLLGAMLLLAWSYAFPPGLYRWRIDGLPPVIWILTAPLSVHAAWLARRAPPAQGSAWKQAAINLSFWVAVIGGALILRLFFPLSTYVTSSASMAPSLRPDDIVAVRGMRARCGGVQPAAGDVVVYRQPGREAVAYMHRVVAGPGHTVALENGRLKIDGAPVKTLRAAEVTVADGGLQTGRAVLKMRETLANGVSYETFDFGPDGVVDTMAPRHLGATEWFLLGDSRDNSLDSRIVGPIDAKNICGIALRILQSEDKSRVGAKP